MRTVPVIAEVRTVPVIAEVQTVPVIAEFAQRRVRSTDGALIAGYAHRRVRSTGGALNRRCARRRVRVNAATAHVFSAARIGALRYRACGRRPAAQSRRLVVADGRVSDAGFDCDERA